MSDKTIIFTHIPKTSGTSLKKTIFRDLYANDKVYLYNGIFNFIKTPRSKYQLLTGHFPFGLHTIKKFKNAQYITFLRNPIERAISHYFFVIQSKYQNYEHSDYNKHINNSIIQILESSNKLSFRNFGSLRDNMQTRYLAGIYNYSSKPNSRLLKIAKRNLDEYYLFGLQDSFEESAKRISERLNLNPFNEIVNTEKRTNNKDEFDIDLMKQIESYHALDLELYAHAKERFEKEFRVSISK